MNPSRSTADPRLVSLLQDLLSQERLPPLDRWFSLQSRVQRWPRPVQKELWDALRRALARGFSLLPETSTPAATVWSGFRAALRGRASEWALRASHPPRSRWGLTEAGIPGWLLPEWEKRIGRSSWSEDDQWRFWQAQETSAPVHVRFRPGPEGEACQKRYRETGLVEDSDVEGIFRLTGAQGLEGGEDWNRGLIEIQDAASQISLRTLGLRPGMRVWDVCAGQGGKTLWAAAELRGKGALVATDIAESKLRSLKERVRRSGWQNIRILGWDGQTIPDFGPEVTVRGGFDRVMVDAPCSASGTWRRDPEGRYRMTPGLLSELQDHQKRLIRLGWSKLKPGGKLAYVTCSWLPSENETVVDAFAAETGAQVDHQELLGLPAFNANTMFVAILGKPS